MTPPTPPTPPTSPPDHLAAAYTGLLAALAAVEDDGSWAPTGCTGWSVRDLTHHCWGDTQRALVALHTPTGAEADLDGTTYWADWGSDPESAAAGRRFTRVSASLFLHWEQLREAYDATARAVLHAASAAPVGGRVRTQGHVLAVGDLLSTLAVEATIHHLDLVVHLPEVAGPSAAAVRPTRDVLDALAIEVAGLPFPSAWDDEVVVRLGTGRADADLAVREALGPLADRLPLFT